MSIRLRLIEEDLRYKFYWGDDFFLAYNKGHPPYGDFYKSKPDFYPVYSPSGRAVTCTCAYRFNHHKSIWIGHAKVNGVNFFHDNNPRLENAGDIILEKAWPEILADRILLKTANGWTNKKSQRILSEERHITVIPGNDLHLIEIVSTLIASEGAVHFGQDTHAYLGIRVTDSMDEEDGGKIINSNGQAGEANTMRQYADWVDYSGTVAGKKVGLTLMNHPSNPKSAFFTRSYGTFLSNFTLHGDYNLPANERLKQRFQILVHEGDGRSMDIDLFFQKFAKSAVFT